MIPVISNSRFIRLPARDVVHPYDFAPLFDVGRNARGEFLWRCCLRLKAILSQAVGDGRILQDACKLALNPVDNWRGRIDWRKQSPPRVDLKSRQ